VIKILKNVTGSPINLADVGKTISAGQEFNTVNKQDIFITSNDTLTFIRNGTLQVGNGFKFYTNALEGEAYFRTRFDDNAFLVDGTSVIEFNPEIVTDPSTGKKACYLFMNMLTTMRELYNTPGDPLYIPGFTPLLGPGGTVQNLEDIHAKHGWHMEEIKAGDWCRPLDLLIYYGWLNAFNSAVNGNNNERVAQDFAKYGVLVFGDGLQNPSHGDYANTIIIIPRIKALNPWIKIYGYVSCNQTYANFTPKVDQWDNLHVDGIFIDSAGYDYGTVATNGRAALNQKIDYVHGKTYSNNVFVNAWNMDHIIGTVNDPSYPNSTWNPSLLESTLTAYDWYLLESFPINTLAWSGSGGYETKAEWASRGVKAINHRNTYGINLGAISVIGDANANASALFNFGFISSLMFSLETFGSSDENFGASSAKTTYRTRPDVTGLGRIYQVAPSIQNDINDNDVYVRYSDYAKFLLDFSSGAQISSISKTSSLPSAPQWTILSKAADQSVTNSAVLVNDNTLQFTTQPNTNYVIRLRVFWNTTSAAADYKYRLTHAGTTTRVRRVRTYSVAGGTSATIPTVAISTAFDSSDQALTATVAGDGIIYEEIILQVGASGGLLVFSFAQNTATAGQSVTNYQGSHLEYKTL
jgi:hypothetical protein